MEIDERFVGVASILIDEMHVCIVYVDTIG